MVVWSLVLGQGNFLLGSVNPRKVSVLVIRVVFNQFHEFLLLYLSDGRSGHTGCSQVGEIDVLLDPVGLEDLL